jgi:hypothetical protein
MATFSSIAAAAAANTLSTASSLSYHHLLSASNGSNNNNSSNSASSDENITQGPSINDINITNSFDTNTSYINNTDFSLCLPSNQFESSSNDPLVRHFFNYRQNDSNLTANYYSNMSTGSFVNTFDYSYPNTTPTTGLGSDAAVPNHGFTSNNPQHHSFVNSYMSYQHPQQQILKQPDSFTAPIQQQQQGNQHQNIYPWMRRIHNSCGEFSFVFRGENKIQFVSSPRFFFVYILTWTFLPYTHNLFYGLFMSFSCA